MRVKKEAGVLLISGLLKLTPSPCLLSLQTFHLIAIISELQRRALLCATGCRIRGEPRAAVCEWGCLSGIAEPTQPGFAVLLP